MKYEIYKDTAGEWRWRFKAANGETIAESSESYLRREDCEHGLDLIRSSADAPLVRLPSAAC